MALYQKSVLNKYLKQLEASKVDKAYKKYANHFLNPTIQENIRNSKEEEYQGIFLTDLFVNVLEYTLKPNANFNLVAEYKNQTNSRKADGAILFDNKATGVIELKGTNTKDLESIRKQAFDYKANQKECVYVVTSNYEKLRFYINDATEFEEFNLFELTREEFDLLYLCLQKDNIENNIPLRIKEASLLEEEQITKKFYKDYSVFKRELYRDLVKRNVKRIKSNLSSVSNDVNETELDEETKAELLKLEKNVKLNLFKKSQKLIDRFLFVFFAEDRGLLPPNSTLQILNKWKADVDFGDDRPLYDMFKQYFKFLDTGRQGTSNRAEIYAYNGGLFKEDVVLDQLEIDNDLLYNHAKTLAAYDFESQVDVNILGHIFENSLNEIESVNAEIEGGDFDKQKSKRKKDGVFYTPKYITKYIVENTIGKLCEEKKNELGFKEEEYFKGRKNRQQATIIKLVEILDTYRDWLLQLTICDPACGSGAFLNQALDFLIKEHNYIDELKAKILGGGLVFSDIENTILENNIYGVDLNEESVEIAKLSLWLRTAQPRRKLNSLNNNIKCGNSLIDSKTVAGDKAFNWKEQFPTVFDPSTGSGGGFDVIIGNPPYVRVEFISQNDVKYYKDKYISASSKFDLSSLFFEKSIKLLNHKGIYSVITSYQFIYTSSGIGLRKFIAENTNCSVVMFSSDSQIFEGATTYAGIFIADKTKSESIKILNANNELQQVNIYKKFNLSISNFSSLKVTVADTSLLEKIESNNLVLKGGEIGYAKTGVVTSADEIFYLTKKQIDEFNLENELVYPIIGPSDLEKWHLSIPETYCLYPYKDIEGKTTLITLSELKDKYIGIYSYLTRNKDKLVARSQGRKDYTESDKWYQLNRPREKWIYDSQKIIYPGTTNRPKFAFDELGQVYRNARVYAYLLNEKYSDFYKIILPILNSSITKYLISLKCPPKANNYYEMSTGFMETFPFILPQDNVKVMFENISEKIISETDQLYVINSKFTKYLQSQFAIEKLTKKLENWYELDFGDFIKEINKAIKVINKERVKNELQPIKELTKLDEMDWMDVFETKKAEAQNLQQQINTTDKEIDAMVYELYGLSEEEISIVENS